jgi:hypothetical protein
VSCPQEPIPSGWRVWRQTAVPDPLVQFAIDVRDHVRSYKRGTIAKVVTYNGQNVGAFVSSHTWTYRNGVLITGICIPGVSLLVQQPTGSVGGAAGDSLATPDPTAAVYGADDLAQPTNWPLVAASGAAVVGVTALFLLALKHAGKAARRSRR